MQMKKKIISVLLAAAMLFGCMAALTGCSEVGYVANINGTSVPAGVYILYSGTAYAQAREKLKEEQPDLDISAENFDYYAQTVSGMSFKDYIKQETMKSCKHFVAVNTMFDEQGLVFDEEERKVIYDNVVSEWDFDVSDWGDMIPYLVGFKTMGDYYQSIGVAQSSLKAMYEAAYKANKLFSHYYGEGGVEEVPASELEKWITENYALTRYISVSLKDSEGNLIEDEAELKKLEILAEGYKTRLEDGESFAAVKADYDKHLKEEEEGEAQAEDDDAEENEAEKPQDSDYNVVINKESTSPTEDFVKTLFEMKTGEVKLVKADTYYYVLTRLDIAKEKDGEYIKNYKDAALNGLKGDEFENVIKDKYEGFSFEEITGVPDYASKAYDAMNGLNAISTISYYGQLFSGYGY